jgi:predicted phosphoribosyltransferase
VDPSLELDIYGDKPWALSPALAGMSQVSLHSKQEHKAWIDEDTKDYVMAEVGNEQSEISERRKWFGKESHRKDMSLKNVEVGMEFANGLLGESSN